MSSNVISFPSNNPINNGVAYRTYTVPEGRFAKVHINAADGFVLLNDKCIISNPIATRTVYTSSSNLSTSWVTNYTVPSDRFFREGAFEIFRKQGSGGDNVSFFMRILAPNGVVRYEKSRQMFDSEGLAVPLSGSGIPMFAGDQIQFRTSTSSVVGNERTISYAASSANSTITDLWLNSGDVIQLETDSSSNTSGSVIIYQEYLNTP